MIMIMNVLPALVLAYQLSAISSAALTARFPVFTFKDLLATASNGTEGPVPSACQSDCAPIVPYAIDGQVSVHVASRAKQRQTHQCRTVHHRLVARPHGNRATTHAFSALRRRKVSLICHLHRLRWTASV
jgi:hypothetical protein